jgi:hypothetical protein
MGVLGSFVKFKLDFGAGSGSLAPAQAGQFTETRSVSVTVPVGYYSQHIFGMRVRGSLWSTRERGLFGIHWINLTAGELDTTWTSTDFSTVEGAIETMWTGFGSSIGPEYRLEEHRWYGFGPTVLPPNPPARVTTIATPIVGTGTGIQAHQVATTVTLRTALRRHWGRIYVPLSPTALQAGGELTDAGVDSLAGSARTGLMVTPATQGITPVVYDRARKLVFGVSAIEMDSVPDIIRRRRVRTTGYKKIFTV